MGSAIELPLDVTITRLEIVAGHDGFLRGKPDPVLVMAAFVVVDGVATLVNRSLVVFKPAKPFPSTVAPEGSGGFQSRVLTVPTRCHYVLLVCALEEDDGAGVRRAYGAMDHPHEVTAWASADAEPAPSALGELGAARFPWTKAVPVELQLEGIAAATRCAGDKWVGATIVRVPPRTPPMRALFRLPFRSADRKNEWTAFVEITY